MCPLHLALMSRSRAGMLLRVMDVLMLPALLAIAIAYPTHPTGGLGGKIASGRPGLIVVGVFMFLAARAAVRLVIAIRSPWNYRFDTLRAARACALVALMALCAVFFIG